MSETTLSAILDRFERVLESPPLSLTKSKVPFNDDKSLVIEPNNVIDVLFSVSGGEMVSRTSQSNYSEARLDRVIVTLHKAMNFDAYAARRDLADMCDRVVRALIADGPDHSYDVSEERSSRKISRPKGDKGVPTDICRAEIHFFVDYDYSEA